jgi:ribosomal protein L2
VGDKVKTVLTIKASRPFSNLVVTDDRAATFMPKVQVAGWVYGDGISAYRENANSLTNLYINYMPKGTYILEYELTANNAGQFASGLATVTCSQAPELTAHSAGDIISVYPK